MRVRRYGVGEPLVFLHGWAASGRVFDTLVVAFESTNECHVVDLPGHGSSEVTSPVSLDDMGRAVVEYISGLGKGTVVVGWAMGAMLALRAAAEAPLRAAVCLSTPSGGPDMGPAFREMASRMARDWPRYVRSSVDVIVGDRVSPEMRQFLCDLMVATPLPVARRALLDVAAQDPLLWAERARCPVLFINGGDDRISPSQVTERLAAGTRESRMVVYEKAGHAPFLEEPDRVVADIREFLEVAA